MFFDIIGPAMRKRMGKSFRKSLGVYSFKMGDKTHKKPGVIPFNIKQRLIENDNSRSRQIIKILERDSHYPFGKFTRKSKFIFDPKRVPLYNVPDLTGFELQPYVSFHTPRIDDELKERMRKLNDFTNPQNLTRSLNQMVPRSNEGK